MRWKPTNVDGRNYCYYYYCWWAGDVAEDGDFRVEGRARALGDARRVEVPLNAALVQVRVVAGERAAAVEEAGAGGWRTLRGVVEVARDPSRRAVVLEALDLNCYRCCWCWG